MSKNTLTINIPKGHKVGSFDEATGQITFVEIPKDIQDRITCFDDVLLVNGTDKREFEKSVHGLTNDEVAYKQLKKL